MGRIGHMGPVHTHTQTQTRNTRVHRVTYSIDFARAEHMAIEIVAKHSIDCSHYRRCCCQR